MRMGYKSNKKQDDFLGLYPIFLLILFVLLKNIIIAQELQPQKKSIEDYILLQNSKLISSSANPNKYSKIIERYNSLLIEKSNPQYKHKLDSLYKLQKLQKIKSNNTQNNETWQSLGPKTKILSSNPNAFGNGRVNCLSFRKVGNDEHIYAGTALGGLYLTNNKINSLTNSPIWNEIEINGHYHLGISDVKNDVSLIDVNNNEIKFDIVIATGDAQGAFFSHASNGIFSLNK